MKIIFFVLRHFDDTKVSGPVWIGNAAKFSPYRGFGLSGIQEAVCYVIMADYKCVLSFGCCLMYPNLRSNCNKYFITSGFLLKLTCQPAAIQRFLPFILVCAFLAVNCKKESLSEVDKLPAITHIGANTFGCLINGKAWMPGGHDNPYPNYRVILENTASDLVLDIRTYNILGASRSDLTMGGIIKSGTEVFPFRNKDSMTIQFSSGTCYMTPHDSLYRSGALVISKLDLSTGIVAGTFECHIFRADCGDTIRISNGRFDKKL